MLLCNQQQGRITLIKVDSHETWNVETTTVLQWARIHNSCADRAARICNNQRSQVFWDLWEQHSGHVNRLAWCVDTIRGHQLNVCKFWTEQFEQKQQTPVQWACEPRQGRIFPKVWHVETISDVPLIISKQFGQGFASKLADWWNGFLGCGRRHDMGFICSDVFGVSARHEAPGLTQT